jgi:two-component system, NtrC family, sensor kinase
LTGYDALSERMGSAMKRRSKGSGDPAKARRPRAAKLKRSTASNAAPHSRADAESEHALLSLELKAAREQQTATAGVLRMISSAPSDSQSILETIVRIAGELCASEYSSYFVCETENTTSRVQTMRR